MGGQTPGTVEEHSRSHRAGSREDPLSSLQRYEGEASDELVVKSTRTNSGCWPLGWAPPNPSARANLVLKSHSKGGRSQVPPAGPQ